MSCIRIFTPLTKAELALIESQKLPYSSPAMRPSLLDRLSHLAQDPSPRIRASAARAYDLPRFWQEKLVDDTDVNVRIALARNDRLPPAVLARLSCDEEMVVRGFVALNPGVTLGIRIALAGDDEQVVRFLASHQLSVDRDDSEE